MVNNEYKVGDLVKFKNVPSVPKSLWGSVALVSEILNGPEVDYHRCFDKSRPIYVLYVNEQCKGLFWEECEIELVNKEL
jgi:hypothetical protein